MRHLKPFLFLLAMLLSCLAGLSLGQDPETARAQAPVVGVPVGQQQGCNREYPVAPFGGGIDPNEAAAIAGCTPAQIDPFQSCGPEPTDQQAIQAWTQCLNQIQTQINQCVESGGQCPGYGNARPSSGPLTGGVTATCDPTTAPGCSSPQYGGSATASAGGIPFCGNVPVAANGSQCSDYPCGPQPGPTDPNIQQWLACYGEYTQGPSPCENPTQVNVGPSNLYNTCVSVAQPAPTANCTGANDPSCGITGSGGSCNAGSNAGATLPRAVADMGRLVSATIPAVPSCPPSSLCPDGSQPASDRGCSSQEQQLCQNGGANEDRIGVQAQIICQAIPPTPAPASASCAGAQAFSNANLGAHRSSRYSAAYAWPAIPASRRASGSASPPSRTSRTISSWHQPQPPPLPSLRR